MEEKDRHFLFGIVVAVGLCFIILVFFTGDEALKDNPAFLYFFNQMAHCYRMLARSRAAQQKEAAVSPRGNGFSQ